MTHRSNGIWLAVAASLAMILGTIVLPSEAVAADASYVRAGFVYDDDANSVHSSVVAGAPVEQLGLAPSASGEIPATGSIEVSRRSNPKRFAPSSVHASGLVDSPLWTLTMKGSSAENALRHFNDHGADFPDVRNALEYAAKAQDLLRTPLGGTLTWVRANGDVVRYHPSSDTFGVMDSTGAPRTFFRPDPPVHGYPTNLDCFYAQ